ncbi:MAG: hypothetical protein NDF55_08945 [archaeon GB-1867-005]|nr:hypothetical protein [Candidatus Culexmicrobium cathedralense]
MRKDGDMKGSPYARCKGQGLSCYNSGRERHGLVFRLSELLDSFCYPGTILSIHFRRRGRDLDQTFVNEPAVFYRILVDLFSGDEESAESYLRLLAKFLVRQSEKLRRRIDPEEFVE